MHPRVKPKPSSLTTVDNTITIDLHTMLNFGDTSPNMNGTTVGLY